MNEVLEDTKFYKPQDATYLSDFAVPFSGFNQFVIEKLKLNVLATFLRLQWIWLPKIQIGEFEILKILLWNQCQSAVLQLDWCETLFWIIKRENFTMEFVPCRNLKEFKISVVSLGNEFPSKIRKKSPNNKNNYGSLRKRQNKAMVGANRFSPSLTFWLFAYHLYLYDFQLLALLRKMLLCGF